MATRGAYGVKLDGNYILSYQHFDSYPEWLGKEICKIVHEVNKDHGWETFRTTFSRVIKVYPGDTAPVEFVNKYRSGESDPPDRSHMEWYNLLRGAEGAALLRAIYRGDVTHFLDAGDFLNDPVCEYGYVINLDDMNLEYYRASKKEVIEGNPRPDDAEENKRSVCRLMTSFPIAAVTELTYLEMLDKAG